MKTKSSLTKVRIAVDTAFEPTLKNIISTTYFSLYRQWRAANPLSRSYTKVKLRNNIKSALSIIDTDISIFRIKESSYNIWHEQGWHEVYNAHWYYAIAFEKDFYGRIIGWIQDAHYEAYHHNDIILSSPYE